MSHARCPDRHVGWGTIVLDLHEQQVLLFLRPFTTLARTEAMMRGRWGCWR